MKTIYLVTGGTGFLGNNVIRQLYQKGAHIRTLIRDREKASRVFEDIAAGNNPGGLIEFVTGDARDEEALGKLFSAADKCEYIFIHTVSIVDITGYKYNREMHDVNVNGTKAVLKICREKNVKRLVYVSSVHAITEPKNRALTHEISDFNPDNVVGAYAKTKAQASAAVMAAVKDGLNAVMVHPAGIIGPDDYSNTHLTQMFIDYYRSRIPAGIKGGYDFVDVRDAASGIIAATETGVPGSCWLLTNRYIGIGEFLDELYKNFRKKKISLAMPMWLARFSLPFLKLYFTLRGKRPLYTPYSLYTLRSNSNFCHEKADRELHYKPHDFKDTVKDTCEFLKRKEML